MWRGCCVLITKDRLREHYDRHLGIYQYQCCENDCPKKYRRHYQYRAHLKSKHGKEIEIPNRVAKVSEENLIFFSLAFTVKLLLHDSMAVGLLIEERSSGKNLSQFLEPVTSDTLIQFF
jgi:hypothetical protein